MKKDYLNKYGYHTKKKYLKIIFYLLVIIIILIFVFFIYFLINLSFKKNNLNIEKYNNYRKKFEECNYIELIKIIDNDIKKDPFNKELLIYRGYSYFLLGEDESNFTKRKNYFFNALKDLRKVIAISNNNENTGNIFFTIGKIYFYLGESYYNLSLNYLNRSKNIGVSRLDLYYTLGILYSYLGNYNESVKILIDALKFGEKDILLLAISNSYFYANDFENAKNFLDITVKKAENSKVKEKAYFLYGEILYKEKDYEGSLDYFNRVIDINENNAEAYYYRGEIYYLKNNIIKARAEWRKTIEIDPSHIKALKRIY